MKLAFSAVIAASVWMGTTAAHAAVITYDFKATIHSARGLASSHLGLTVDSEISGSFSYDTDAEKTLWTGGSAIASQHEYYATGSVETDQIVKTGASASANPNDVERTYVLDYESGTDFIQLTDFADSVAGASTGLSVGTNFAYEHIYLYGDDALSSDSLPTTLLLSDFAFAEYRVYGAGKAVGRDAYAIGTITEFTQRSSGGSAATGVPELSASGSVSALGLLAGGALVLSSRRRETDPS